MKKYIYLLFFFLYCISPKPAFCQTTTAIKLSSSGWTPIYCVTSDSIGNYYTIGSFHSSITFDSSGYNKTFSSTYSEALFIVKYNCSNKFVWAMIIDNTARWTLMPSIKYKNGSLYATTSFNGSTSIKSTNGNSTSKTCSGTLGGLIMKITTNGVLVWANVLESSTTKAELNDIDISKKGDIYVAGMFFGTGKIYGQNSTTKTTSSSSGQEDDIYMKFNEAGEIKWAKEGKSVGDDVGAFLHVDNDDNLYINHQVGCCSNYTVTFGSNSFTNNTSWGFALTKIDTSDGSTDWFTSVPGEALALGGVTTDEKGFLYSVGTFSGTKTIYSASGGNSVSLTSNGQWDFYIAKYSRQGDLIWAKSFGSSGNDYGNRCVYKDGKIYFNLTYSGSFTVNTGTSYSFSNSGGSDDVVMIFDTTGACKGGYKINGTSSSRSLSLDYTPNG
ncbi:MAG: hypothetical protein HYZ42_13515, partial [Bacteroidetes bacterium]|nr:hypothetical protein [Bacteroidota bacterium]